MVKHEFDIPHILHKPLTCSTNTCFVLRLAVASTLAL